MTGRISLCPYQSCEYRCCDFQQGNFIVTHPGELRHAAAAGKSLNHLRVIDVIGEGHKVICTAEDTSSCDNGYKPLDCQSYPIFPTIEHEEDRFKLTAGLKGRKCPLLVSQVHEHAKWVLDQWTARIRTNPSIAKWLARVSLVGYEQVDEPVMKNISDDKVQWRPCRSRRQKYARSHRGRIPYDSSGID